MTATPLKVNGYLLMPEIAAPTTPPSSTVAEYPKSDGHLYQKDDTGTETDLAQAGSVGTAVAPYAVTIGDGSTTAFTITHNLGTKDVLVHVYSLTSPFPAYVMSPEHTTTNTLTLTFASAPATNSVRVVVAAYAGVSLDNITVTSVQANEGTNMTPNPGAEVDASWWVAAGSTITRTTSNPDTGSASFLVTASTNGVQSNFNSPILDLPNLKGAYFIEARVRQGTGTSGESGAVAIRWFDESEVQVGSTVSKVYSFGASYSTWRLPAQFPPDGAVKIQFSVLQVAAGVTAGDTFHVDNVMVGQLGSIKTDVLAIGEPDSDQLRIVAAAPGLGTGGISSLSFRPNNSTFQSDDFAVAPGIEFAGHGLVTIKGPSRTDTGDDVNNGPEIRLEPTGSTTNGRSQIILEANEIEIFQNDNGTHVYVLETGDVDIGASDDVTIGATDDMNLNFANLFLNGTEALVGAWATYSPTVDQGATSNIARTVEYAKYSRIGRIVHAQARLAITGTGTAGAGIYVDLPVPPASSVNLNIGTFALSDASANTFYYGAGHLDAALDQVAGIRDSVAGNAMGANPNMALANGDVIWIDVTYEAAS